MTVNRRQGESIVGGVTERSQSSMLFIETFSFCIIPNIRKIQPNDYDSLISWIVPNYPPCRTPAVSGSFTTNITQKHILTHNWHLGTLDCITVILENVPLLHSHFVLIYQPCQTLSLEVVAKISISWQLFAQKRPWMTLDDMTVFYQKCSPRWCALCLEIVMCSNVHTHYC